LSWACYLLSKHHDIQTALRNEIREALSFSLKDAGSAAQEVDIATVLESLPLLNGVINESLRLFPTVPITMREAVRDTSLAGYEIPRGTKIIISPWAMNRSPEVWGPDATEFRPERWITESDDEKTIEGGSGHRQAGSESSGSVRRPNQTGGASSNYQFLTFLHGPRSCIGQGFARAELRCFLASLMLGNFSWELGMKEEDVKTGGAITIKPANGMHLAMKVLSS
jgi:cytochrome P450